MKVYIYNEFIRDKNILFNNNVFASIHKLQPHLAYLQDTLNALSAYATDNPDEADFFFVPIFITGFQWMNIDPVYLIDRCKFLNKGKHILVATGDVGQRAESKHEMTYLDNPQRAYNDKYKWLDSRFTLIALESLATLHEQDIAILPYQHSVPEINLNIPRDIFMSFVGKMVQHFLPATHIRGGRLFDLKSICQNDKDIVIGEASDLIPSKFISYHDAMQRSTFTLCPAGYGRWTFRFVEALLLGSIPVLLSDDYVLPFADVISWDKYCYVFKEKDLFALPEMLRNIPPEEIFIKQKNILKDNFMFKKEFVTSQIIKRLENHD